MDLFSTSLSKAMKYCSSKEVCTFEMLNKLTQWNIPTELHEKIIDSLKKENFIDDERYAIAFALDKLKFNHWGKIKIAYELRNRKFSRSTINYATVQIPNDLYQETAKKLILTKFKSLKTGDLRNKKLKTIAYMTSKGFEYQTITEILKQLS